MYQQIPRPHIRLAQNHPLIDAQEVSYVSAVIDRILFVRWVDPERRDIETLRTVMDALLRDLPLATVHINAADTRTPDAKTMRAFAHALPSLFKTFALTIAVFDGTGTRVALNRSAVKAMVAMSRKSQTVQVVPAIEVAFHKLQPFTSKSRNEFFAELERLGLWL